MPRWSATAPASPGRTASRRPGACSSRCSTRRRRSTPTQGERGARRPANGSSPTTAAGTDRGWIMSAVRKRGAREAPQPAVAERGGAVAVPADRRLRVPVGLPHGRAGRARRRDRLAVRAALRLAERVRDAARPRGRHVPARAVRDQPPVGARLRAGHEHAGHDLEDADRLGRGARRAHDGPAPRRGHDHAAHAAAGRRRRRAPARAHGECLEGSVEIELVCEPVFDYGRTPAEWALVDDDLHAADASGAGQTIRLQTDMALGIEGDRVRARHVLRAGERALLRAVLGRGPRRAGRRRRGERAPGRDDALLARLAGRARGSPTIAGATRSSARRWRSRA